MREQRKHYGVIYKEDNVRSSPLKFRMKQKECVTIRLEKKEMCEADRRGMARMGLPKWCFWA